MPFVPEWAPNVHPMFVHFPIGLLVTAVALDVISLIPRTEAIRRAVPVLYVAGALSAIATYFTGQAAADGLAIPADAEPILTEHADFALWTVIFFGVFAAVRAGVEWLVPSAKLPFRSALVAVAIGGLVLIWETAERGSAMVYVHAVAVQERTDRGSQRASRDAPAENSPAAKSGATVDVHDAGWIFDPAGAGSLQDARIDWLIGNAEAVSTGDANGEVFVDVDGETILFVINDTLESVQFTAELDPANFSGTIGLVHHLQNSSTYDHLTLSGDTLELGRITSDTNRSFDEALTSTSGWIRVRVTGHGTHFRGYMDDRMIVHGHSDPLPPGRVGLRIEGEGTLRIGRLEARAL